MILRLSRDNRTALVGDRPVTLTANEWTVLERLCSGRVVTNGELVRALYDDTPDYAYMRCLQTTVWRLRRRTGLTIRNHHHSGYQLEGVDIEHWAFPLMSTELLDWMEARA